MRIALTLLSALTACADKAPVDTSDSGPVTPAEEVEACALRAETGREMIAGRTPDTTAPAMPTPGTEPATIQIVEDAPNYVRVEVAEPGTLVLFASEVDVLLHVQDGLDIVESEEPSPVDGCPDEIPERHDVVLDEAGTYHVRIAWAGYRTLWVYGALLPSR